MCAGEHPASRPGALLVLAFCLPNRLPPLQWVNESEHVVLSRVLLTLILTAGASSATPKGFGHVHALLVHPESETLLVGTHHGLFRSPDAGVTWNRVSPQGDVPGSDFMTLAMHPQTHSRIYAGGHDLGILRSEDFGQTWQRAAQGIPSPDVHALAVDPHKPQQLYAWVVDRELYRSRDSGRSWHRATDGPSNPEVRALASVNISTGMGGIFLYSGTADGVFRVPD